MKNSQRATYASTSGSSHGCRRGTRVVRAAYGPRQPARGAIGPPAPAAEWGLWTLCHMSQATKDGQCRIPRSRPLGVPSRQEGTSS